MSKNDADWTHELNPAREILFYRNKGDAPLEAWLVREHVRRCPETGVVLEHTGSVVTYEVNWSPYKELQTRQRDHILHDVPAMPCNFEAPTACPHWTEVFVNV